MCYKYSNELILFEDSLTEPILESLKKPITIESIEINRYQIICQSAVPDFSSNMFNSMSD